MQRHRSAESGEANPAPWDGQQPRQRQHQAGCHWTVTVRDRPASCSRESERCDLLPFRPARDPAPRVARSPLLEQPYTGSTHRSDRWWDKSKWAIRWTMCRSEHRLPSIPRRRSRHWRQNVPERSIRSIYPAKGVDGSHWAAMRSRINQAFAPPPHGPARGQTRNGDDQRRPISLPFIPRPPAAAPMAATTYSAYPPS